MTLKIHNAVLIFIVIINIHIFSPTYRAEYKVGNVMSILGLLSHIQLLKY